MSRPALIFASFFFAAAAARAVAPAPAAANPGPNARSADSPVAPAPEGAALPMKFDKVPLGNVLRVLSARFGVPFAIEAGAKAPITGDFHTMDLKSAVAEAARQAGLFAIPLGKEPSAGFRLSRNPPPAPPVPSGSISPPAGSAPPAARPPDPQAGTAAEQARAKLLQERARLLESAANLDR
jgi:hypothetical protein